MYRKEPILKHKCVIRPVSWHQLFASLVCDYDAMSDSFYTKANNNRKKCKKYAKSWESLVWVERLAVLQLKKRWEVC